MVTIYDIAKAVGVSPATVSKAFNDYSEVSRKTKDKILKAANDMGYIPNMTAQSLKTKQSFLVGVIFSENVGIGLDHHFFSVVLEEFRHFMGEHGYDTIFINKSIGKRKIGYLEHCKYRNVDGVFIITTLNEDIEMASLLDSDIKFVTTDMIIDNRPYVLSDNVGGAIKAVEYLYSKGHRKIAHLGGPNLTISADERLQGFKMGLEKVGLKFDGKYVIEAEWFKYEQAYNSTLELLDRFTGGEMPTAIFVASDIMALGAIKAIKQRGLRVPEDISIMGFDDVELAGYVAPSLTTMKQNTKLIGKKVADTLYKLISGERLEKTEFRIPVEIVERESVIEI